MNVPQPSCWSARLGVLVLTGVLCAGLPTYSQQADPAALPEVRVYALKYVEAKEVATIVQQLFGAKGAEKRGAVTASADLRTNSLVVRATAKEFEMITEILKRLDVETPPKPALKTVTFPLKHLSLKDRVVYDALRLMLDDDSRLRLAQDPVANQLIVQGTPEGIRRVQALIEQLDVPREQPEAPTENFLIRVVWLMTGEAAQGAKQPGADLEEVLAQLDKVGIEDPKIVGQSLVMTELNQQFDVVGLPAPKALVGGTWKIEGTLGEQKSKISLSIAIQAQQPRMVGGTALNLKTTITAPTGHSVLLGVTPSETNTSIFVVQVVQAKKKIK